MKLYELTYLISPEFSEEETKIFQEEINSFIQKEGGLINEINSLKKMELAYPIKKNKTAYLSNLNFYFSPEKLENLEKKLKEKKGILRYLIESKKITKKIPVLMKKPKKIVKPKKVELEEIEKKLEEILGET